MNIEGVFQMSVLSDVSPCVDGSMHRNVRNHMVFRMESYEPNAIFGGSLNEPPKIALSSYDSIRNTIWFRTFLCMEPSTQGNSRKCVGHLVPCMPAI